MAKDKKKSKDLIKAVESYTITDPATSKEMEEVLSKKGMTKEFVADKLLELCDFTTIKLDKNGEVHESLDGNLRYRALDLWAKLTGAYSKESSTDKVHNHLHLEKLSDEQLRELEQKANKGRVAKKKG